MQKWKIGQYTLMDEYEHLGELMEHTITIVDQKTEHAVRFQIDTIGLLDDILELIVFIFEFKDNHKTFDDFLNYKCDQYKVNDEFDYQLVMKQSNSLSNFLNKKWIQLIKKHIESSKGKKLWENY